jgi:thiamine-monophosphate kinase
MLTDGVDFDLAACDPRRVVRKALAVNLSDLAAMAARPEAALVSLALPRSAGIELATALYEGLLPLAEEFDVAIAGGDTNTWNGPLVISVTAVGSVTRSGVWRRSGARPGDRILVTGEFGGSILGRHFDFVPRVQEALYWSARHEVHAAIDVSDGLSLDLHRLCQASGVGAIVDLEKIPIASAAHELAVQRADGVSPLDHALADGEDFELILAAAPQVAQVMLREPPAGVKLTCIGEFSEAPGLWRRAEEGNEPLAPRGYVH